MAAKPSKSFKTCMHVYTAQCKHKLTQICRSECIVWLQFVWTPVACTQGERILSQSFGHLAHTLCYRWVWIKNMRNTWWNVACALVILAWCTPPGAWASAEICASLGAALLLAMWGCTSVWAALHKAHSARQAEGSHPDDACTIPNIHRHLYLYQDKSNLDVDCLYILQKAFPFPQGRGSFHFRCESCL